MRILAIRGENLASLAGRFEIDFTAQPLERAGVFVITGPTGAGKSTILDALCLALFARTPRLRKRGGPLIGRVDQLEEERLSANDARSLLRHGTGHGFAQVDFRGQDGQIYRASWSVRRAHERPEGRLQRPEMLLERPDSGRVLARKKSDVVDAVEARLGLTFDQFRRSALLAQGDFAAFLKADSDERAELLERMTGTEIYSQLSIAAFRRAADERSQLEALEARRHGIDLLPEAERGELVARVDRLAEQLETGQVAFEELQAAMRWHARHEQLKADEAEARHQLASCQAAWEAAATRRAELADVERVLPLRGPLSAADRSEAAQMRAEAESRRAEAALADQRQHVAAAETALEVAESTWRRARAALAEREPELTEAARLDSHIDSARAELLRASESRAVARAAAEAAAEARERASTARRLVSRELDAVTAWLDAHTDAEVLAADWPRCERALSDYVAAHAEREEADANQTLLAEERTEAASRRRECLADVRERAERVARSEATYQEAESAAERVDREALRRRRRGVAEARSTLEHRSRLVAEGRRVGQDRERQEGQLSASTERAADLEGRLLALESEQERLRGATEEAQRARDRARAALELTERRAELRGGEPCPLCGSRQHPWAGDAAPLGGLLGETEQRLRALSTQLTAVGEELSKARAALAAERRTAAACRERLGELEVAVERLVAAWQVSMDSPISDLRPPTSALGPQLSDPGSAIAEQDAATDEAIADLGDGRSGSRPALAPPVDAVAVEVATERLERVREQLDAAAHQLETDEAAADSAEAQVRSRRRALEGARREKAEGDARLTAAEAELERIRRTDEANAERLRAATERMASALDVLEPALGDRPMWRLALAKDPPSFVAECTAEVRDFALNRERRDAIGEELREWRAQEAVQSAKAEEKAKAAEAAQAVFEARRTQLAELQAQRSRLLEGRSTEAVRAELEATVDQAERARDAARQEREAARQGLAAARAAADGARSALAEKRAERDEARAEVDAQLASLDATIDDVRRLLQRDDDWVRRRREELGQLQGALRDAQTVLAERCRLRAAHEAADSRPSLDAEAAKAAGESLARELRGASSALESARLRLAVDDEARQQAAELDAAVTRQAAEHRRWDQLSQLIGSHNGKAFREYAQGLTLDRLIGQTNVHLRRLAPRYGLSRVPGPGLHLQVVDRDMGDEVRSVNSLSGGESFLVSLALALGLSSLSAQNGLVESLFIDEGFGSLDPISLETALGALDSLQASGRKVGLISQVPGLAERIGIQIQVVPTGVGRSRIRVRGLAA